MPFVIRLHSTNLEAESELRPDPVTGAPLPFVAVGGLTPAEKQAVRNRLQLSGAIGPDAGQRYRVTLPGGRVAEAVFPNLHTDARCESGTLAAAEPSPELARLAFELARAGNLLLMPNGVSRPLVPTEALRHKVILRWVTATTVPTASHLWGLIAPPPPPVEAPEPVAEQTPEADVEPEVPPAVDESDVGESATSEATEPPVL